MQAASPDDAVITRPPRMQPDVARMVGARIREAREAQNITQDSLAKFLQISRSAIAQWESGTTSPSLTSLQDMSNHLHTTPEYLAFGIKDGVRTVYKSPERGGMHAVPIVSWGDSPDEMRTVGELALEEDYAKDLSLTGSADTLRAYVVPIRGLVEGMDRDDRAIMDVSATKPARPGVYVYWNGITTSMAEMRATLAADGKPVVQITEAGASNVMPLDHVRVLGRVVAHLGRV